MWHIKLFKYIEPVWLGNSGEPSIRRVLALAFSFNLIHNITETLANPKLMNSYAEVAMLLGIEAGLIAALMSLTTYTTALASKKDSSSTETD
jgi:hypothetical protein